MLFMLTAIILVYWRKTGKLDRFGKKIMKILIFALDNIYFGIPFADIRFVKNKNEMDIKEMYAVSGYITGIVDYHDKFFPVYNLSLRLGLAKQQFGCLAVVDADKLIFGIEISEDSKIYEVNESEIIPFPALMGNKMDYFANIILLENKNFAYLMDVRRLIHQDERQEICQLVKS